MNIVYRKFETGTALTLCRGSWGGKRQGAGAGAGEGKGGKEKRQQGVLIDFDKLCPNFLLT